MAVSGSCMICNLGLDTFQSGTGPFLYEPESRVGQPPCGICLCDILKVCLCLIPIADPTCSDAWVKKTHVYAVHLFKDWVISSRVRP